ncbi:LOW QUALITY PROTEIN: hypothetical protein HID58_006300, partial [Brassica napus]
AGVGRKFDGEAGNVGIKGDASDHTPGACALYSASAQAWLSSSTNRVEECMGQYPGILRGRILARLRIRRTKRLNKTRRPKLKILMLDSTGLACASRACKGVDVVVVASCLVSGLYLDFGGTFSMFVLMPGDNLVDSWCRSRSLGVFYFNLPPAVSHNQLWDNLALCSHGIRGILGMLSQNLKVERNPEAGWIVVKESAGCVDLQGDLLVYPFDSKSSSPGRLLLIPRLFGAVSSFASSSYPLKRLKDETICVRLVNPEPGPKLKILMLDSTGLACASRACKGCNGLSGGSHAVISTPTKEGGLLYFNLPPAVSHNQLWDNLALCSHGIRGILGMLSQNLKVERYILLKRIGTRRLDGLSSRNLLVVWTFKGPSRISFRLEVVFAGSSFASSSYPLKRLKDETICVRLVNPEYRDASHSTFHR